MNAEIKSSASLEDQIELARLSMECAYTEGDRAKARRFFDQMTNLIRQRTPERISQMEVERGLR